MLLHACSTLVGAIDIVGGKVAKHEERTRPFWSIGEGFEGSASDWVEYVVWLLGVIGVFYYMMNPNMRRNLHEVDHDEPVNYEPMGEGDEDWERSDERRPKES